MPVRIYGSGGTMISVGSRKIHSFEGKSSVLVDVIQWNPS